MSDIHGASRAQQTQVRSDRGVGLALTPAERTKAANVAAGSGGAQVTGHARNYAGTSYVAKPSIGKFFTDLSGYNKEATQFKEQRLAKHRDRLVEELLQPSPDVEKVKACIKKMSILQKGASLRLSSEIPADPAGRNALQTQQARLLTAIASVKTQLGKDTRFDQALGVVEMGFQKTRDRLGRAIAFDAQVQAFAAKPLDVSKAATDNWTFSPDGGTGAILARSAGKIDTVLKVDAQPISRQKTMQIAEVINMVSARAAGDLPFDFPQHKLVTLAGTAQPGAAAANSATASVKWDKAKKDEVRQTFKTEIEERKKVADKLQKKDDDSTEYKQASTAKSRAVSSDANINDALLNEDYGKVRTLVDAYLNRLNDERPPPTKSLEAVKNVLTNIDAWTQPEDVREWNTTAGEIENIYKGLLDERTRAVDKWKGDSASPQLKRAADAKGLAQTQCDKMVDARKKGGKPADIRAQVEKDAAGLKAELIQLSQTKGVHSQTWQRTERAYFALQEASDLIGEWETVHAKPSNPVVDSARKAATDSVLEKYHAASDLHAKVLAKWERSGNSGKIAQARVAAFEAKADHARLRRAVNEGATPQDIQVLVKADIDRSIKARDAVFVAGPVHTWSLAQSGDAVTQLRNALDEVDSWLTQPAPVPASVPAQVLAKPQPFLPTLGDLKPGLDAVATAWETKAKTAKTKSTEKTDDWKKAEKVKEDLWLRIHAWLEARPGSPESKEMAIVDAAHTKWAAARKTGENKRDALRNEFEDARKKAVATAPDAMKIQWATAQEAFADAEVAMLDAKKSADDAEIRHDKAKAIPGLLANTPLLMQSGLPGEVASKVPSHEKIAAMRSRQFGLDLGANVVLLPLLGLGDHLAPDNAGLTNCTNLMVHKPDGSSNYRLGVMDVSPHTTALDANPFKDLVKDLKALAASVKKDTSAMDVKLGNQVSLHELHRKLFKVGGGFITEDMLKNKQETNDAKNLLAKNMLAGIVNGIEYFERHQQLFADAHTAAGGPLKPGLFAEVAQAFAGLSQKERQALKSLAT